MATRSDLLEQLERQVREYARVRDEYDGDDDVWQAQVARWRAIVRTIGELAS